MFAALGRLVARRPWFVILGWVVLAGLVLATAPKLTSTTNEAQFLPDHYESIKALKLQAGSLPSRTDIGAIMVFDRTDGKPLAGADSAQLAKISTDLGQKSFKSFSTITPPASQNKRRGT